MDLVLNKLMDKVKEVLVMPRARGNNLPPSQLGLLTLAQSRLSGLYQQSLFLTGYWISLPSEISLS